MDEEMVDFLIKPHLSKLMEKEPSLTGLNLMSYIWDVHYKASKIALAVSEARRLSKHGIDHVSVEFLGSGEFSDPNQLQCWASTPGFVTRDKSPHNKKDLDALVTEACQRIRLLLAERSTFEGMPCSDWGALIESDALDQKDFRVWPWALSKTSALLLVGSLVATQFPIRSFSGVKGWLYKIDLSLGREAITTSPVDS
jgi:hypothetical protein